MSLSSNKAVSLLGTVVLLFAGVLGWLGWRSVQQDRALARQRRVEQLEAAADRISAALYRRTAELEETLADPMHAKLPPGAVVVEATKESVQVHPADALLYRPIVPTYAEPAATVFAAGETLEFEKNDPASAADAFRRLTQSPDPGVRAAALLRLGRTLAKAGRPAEALHHFDALCSMGMTPVGGVPAELVAAEARCSLLEKLGRRSDLEREGRLLHTKLLQGRWPLPRARYEFAMEEARAWSGMKALAPKPDEKAALSATMEELWSEWLRGLGTEGRRWVPTTHGPIAEVWTSSAQKLTALLVPAAAFAPALAHGGGFEGRLIDAEARVVLGAEGPLPRMHVDRSPASTKFPWTLQVSTRDDGSPSVSGRTWLFTCGLAMLVLLLGAATYLAARHGQGTRCRALADRFCLRGVARISKSVVFHLPDGGTLR
jgi:hypothetical protein